ncbi:MAG: chemotaxis protein CheD [Candidatus Methanospirareceae archaeon]
MGLGREEKRKKYVGIGEIKVAHNPDLLIIPGLGSCVALALYDKVAKIGGMAHIMLPRSWGEARSSKFADVAVPMLLKEMERCRADRRRIVAKIAGGASLFPEINNKIGESNIKAVKELLRREGIKLVAEDTGGDHGRTVVLDTCTGEMRVKTKTGIRSL